MRIVTMLPSTGYQAPTGAELRELLKIARTAYDWLPPIDEGEFARAMWAVGHMYRTAEPDSGVYYSAHVDFVLQYSRPIRSPRRH